MDKLKEKFNLITTIKQLKENPITPKSHKFAACV
jgi:hypothetical protein